MWNPDVTVAAICEHQGKFLIVEERSKSTGELVLNQPAGHLEQGESLIEAVIRETKEETCRHFIPSALIGLYRLPINSGKTYIRYTFYGEIGDADPQLTLDTDIIETHWFSRAELKTKPNLRSPLVLACIDDYLSGVSYPLSILKEPL